MLNILIVVVLGAAVSVAGGLTGAYVAGVPVMVICAVLAFAIQWVAFVPAFLKQTERFYDLVGSLTYLSVTGLAVYLTPEQSIRSVLIAVCIGVWAMRLGSFLVRRISQDGSDSRFDKIKPNPVRFLFTWSLQGLWVVMTAACGWAAITSGSTAPFGVAGVVGIVIWICGFAIEVMADRQKRVHRAQYGSGTFITTGLWRYSRHPNYFGEIVLWSGIAVMALPALQGWAWATLISPLFVFVLLTRISGIPMLQAKGKKRWGENPEYQAYLNATPVLVPFLGRKG